MLYSGYLLSIIKIKRERERERESERKREGRGEREIEHEKTGQKKQQSPKVNRRTLRDMQI